MSWPLSQDYNEAIQDPAHSFSDAELKTGEVVANALGIPMPRSGNFADVYEVRCPSGSRWAVKCFTREVHGLRERYAEISKYLHQAKLPFTVDFQYLEQGIRVRGQWYPILKMQWVEGFVLNEFVRDNLDKKPILEALGQIWLRMASRLRETKLAHCDLQHGNVMFVPGRTAQTLAVKLIDYDGMFVPSLAGTKSGEVGHPAYQHPERLRSGTYNQDIDRFSLLSIATALHCLTLGGRSLWERYDTGDNLLFRQVDLQAPAESPLFQELLAIDDPQTRKLVTALVRACQGPLEKVPLLPELLPEEKPTHSSRLRLSAKPEAAAQGADWDFRNEEPDASVVRKRRQQRGMSLWVWGAMGVAAAVLLVGVGMALSLFVHKGPASKEIAPVAQNKPETNAVENLPADVKLSKRLFLLSPDGGSLALSNEGEKSWRLVNFRTGSVIYKFPGHEGAVTAAAFSADGRHAVTSGADGTLRLWDLRTGKPIGTPKVLKKPVLSLALSPDGTKAAYANGSVDVEVWNFRTKNERHYPNDHKVASVAFSSDGSDLVLGYVKSDQTEDVAFRWPLSQGLPARRFNGLPRTVNRIAISPDGKYVAAGQQGDPCQISIWRRDASKISQTISLPKDAVVHQLLFSPNSERILAVCESLLGVWRVRDGEEVCKKYPSPARLFTGTFSPDGKEVRYAGSQDGKIISDSMPLPEDRRTAPRPDKQQTASGKTPVDPKRNDKSEMKSPRK